MGEAPHTTDEKTTVVHYCPLCTIAIAILIRKADHQQKTQAETCGHFPGEGEGSSFLCLIPALYNSVQLLMVSGAAKPVYRRWKEN